MLAKGLRSWGVVQLAGHQVLVLGTGVQIPPPQLSGSFAVRSLCEHLFVEDRVAKLVDTARSHPDLLWLAGLVEGEGSFFPGSPSAPGLPVMQVAMVDVDVISRVARMLGVAVRVIRPRREEWKTIYTCRVRGAPAVAWMTALRPHLGLRRRSQVNRAIASYAPRSGRLLDDEKATVALDLLDSGATVREVADRFGVSIWCIYDLRLGRTHRHLPRRMIA
jgi:hypothetical protein